MLTRLAQILRARAARRRVFGIIEWDDEFPPTLIVGATAAAVNRAALARLVQADMPEQSNAGPKFDLPVPGPDADDAAVAGWLDTFREYATVPWFTIVDSSNTLHA